VELPFGVTLPETVAVVGPTLVTGPVVAVGAVAPTAAEAEDSRAVVPRAVVATATPIANSLDMMCGDNSNGARCATLARAILRTFYTRLA
jgi:hypothetical protein